MLGESGGTAGGRPVEGRAASKRLRWLLVLAGAVAAASSAPAGAQVCPMRCVAGDPFGDEPYDEGKECTVPTDCNVCNPDSLDYDQQFCAAATNSGGICQLVDPCIHLEWRPQALGASGPGQIVNVGLYAVSSTGFPLSFEELTVLLSWDPSVIRLVGKTDPCTVQDPCNEACPNNTYKWFSSTFPNDCDAEGINAPCPGNPANDGSALYIALSQLQCSPEEPAPPPFATSAGLHVTTFQFEVLSDIGTSSQIDIPFNFGGATRTRITGVIQAGDLGTGDIGPPATVSVVECSPPSVLTFGSKVIEIDPGLNAGEIAFLVTSDTPGVQCMNRYAQASGELGSAAVFRTTAAWGDRVALRGRRIIPEGNYYIQTDCGSPGAPNLSPAVSVTMNAWTDTDDNQVVDFTDIARTVSGFLGEFEGQNPTLNKSDVDLVGITDPNPALSRLLFCTPNDVVDFKDIAIVVESFLVFGTPGVSHYAETCDVEFCQ